MASIRVTVCELPDDPAEFPAAWRGLREHVRADRSEVVVLPELPAGRWFAHAPAFDPEVWRSAVVAHEALLASLDELAPAVVLASRPVDEDGRRFNRAFARPQDGAEIVAHAKACLPDEVGFRESTWFHPGGQPVSIETGGLTIGFLLCTEAMYPERARALGRAGAELIAAPRATGGHGRWEVAVRMAAIVSGAYVASSNRCGPGAPGSGVVFGGRGFVVSPDGEVLTETSAAAPWATVAIDTEVARIAKSSYPRTVRVEGGSQTQPS